MKFLEIVVIFGNNQINFLIIESIYVNPLSMLYITVIGSFSYCLVPIDIKILLDQITSNLAFKINNKWIWINKNRYHKFPKKRKLISNYTNDNNDNNKNQQTNIQLL